MSDTDDRTRLDDLDTGDFIGYKRTIEQGQLRTDGMGRFDISGLDISAVVPENVELAMFNDRGNPEDTPEYVFDIKVNVYRVDD